ncbi:unnamed protein product [Rotaria magnacalcarata]|nr:unnamed protein product [Rotaria magnacalcarata]
MPQYMLDRLRPSLTESELPHLYYTLKDHKIEEPLRPIVSGIKSPLAKISSFLDKNIRPLFDKHTPYTLSNSIKFLQHLKRFQTTSEMNIYTFDIVDLYTMIPQKESVLVVCEFLGRQGYKKVRGLSINTIKSLFLHVLESSYFVLQLSGKDPKFYKQIRRGAMGSACTQVLADILPSEKIELLSELNKKKDPNIKITREGGKTVDYLDVTTTIEMPNFRTTVFRKFAAQPYVLPFHSSHPRHIIRNIPYTLTLRAAQNFGARFHQIWQEIFEGTPLDNIPVIYANRVTDSLRHLLVKKRPSKEAIRLLPTSSEE